jgi:hypothetical protein
MADSDPARWLRVRQYLNEHRRELTRAAQELYPAQWRVAGTPLLARAEWLPAVPVPLDQVVLDLQPDTPPARLPEVDVSRFLPVREDGTRYATYADAMAALARPALFEDRVSYRLLDASGNKLAFGMGRYFDLINTCEAVAHEFAAAMLDGAGTLDGAAELPLRATFGDPTDLARRPVLTALTTLLLSDTADPRISGLSDTADPADARMILHWRDPAKVATGGGMYTTAPVGIFQPSDDARWNVVNDFGLWQCLVREYNEELLGAGEDYGSDVRPIDYSGWPLSQRLTAGIRGMWWLGLGLDPLSLVSDMLAVVVLDRTLFDGLVRGAGVNDEGRLVVRRFTSEEITRLTSLAAADSAEYMEPASAALLRLAWENRERLFGSR